MVLAILLYENSRIFSEAWIFWCAPDLSGLFSYIDTVSAVSQHAGLGCGGVYVWDCVGGRALFVSAITIGESTMALIGCYSVLFDDMQMFDTGGMFVVLIVCSRAYFSEDPKSCVIELTTTYFINGDLTNDAVLEWNCSIVPGSMFT